MSQRITIQIDKKLATCLTELPIVCGNCDYEVEFLFDEEWDKHNVKTAMFVINGKSIPRVFEGNVCKIPVIQDALILWVGVFAGTIDDGTLSTTTPALVRCKPCVTDGDNVPVEPEEDIYNQIIGLLDKVEGEISDIENDVEKCDERIEELGKSLYEDIDPMKEQVELLEAKVNSALEDTSKNFNSIQEINQDIGNLRQEVSGLDESVSQIGGAMVELEEKTLPELNKTIVAHGEAISDMGDSIDDIASEMTKTYELLHEVVIAEDNLSELTISQDSDGQPLNIKAFYLYIKFPISTAEKTLDGRIWCKNKSGYTMDLLNFWTSKVTSTTADKYFFASGRVENGMWCDVWKSSQTGNGKDTNVTKVFFNHTAMLTRCYTMPTFILKFTSGNVFDVGTTIRIYGVRAGEENL